MHNICFSLGTSFTFTSKVVFIYIQMVVVLYRRLYLQFSARQTSVCLFVSHYVCVSVFGFLICQLLRSYGQFVLVFQRLIIPACRKLWLGTSATTLIVFTKRVWDIKQSFIIPPPRLKIVSPQLKAKRKANITKYREISGQPQRN